MHDIISVNKDEYIMIAESYYSLYHQKSVGENQLANYFDGYKYLEGLVICFDKEGRVLWDKAFETDHDITLILKKKINVSVDKEKVICRYTYGGSVRSITFENGRSNDRVLSYFKRKYKSDNVKEKEVNEVDFWYNNYVIAYGYHKIKGKSIDGNKKKMLFYFNKIQYLNQ